MQHVKETLVNLKISLLDLSSCKLIYCFSHKATFEDYFVHLFIQYESYLALSAYRYSEHLFIYACHPFRSNPFHYSILLFLPVEFSFLQVFFLRWSPSWMTQQEHLWQVIRYSGGRHLRWRLVKPRRNAWCRLIKHWAAIFLLLYGNN